jgi:pyruvate,water dikinase
VAAVESQAVAWRVAARRAEYHANLSLCPPPVVVGTYDPTEDDWAAGDGEGESLHGIAVNPGVVIGPARVILRTGDDQVRPGEILVAPFTDPGWTPYFLNAAAIVMDMGGAMSHGSIIAREFGIPAVVNVGWATKTIRTGQTLRVDGNRGTVQILSLPDETRG